ncbi:MAG: hypothetical protein F6K47_02480 [Symploca sp. SIO2E6]|nr:hypothetical protein [Symploca sp. SIO2E6]
MQPSFFPPASEPPASCLGASCLLPYCHQSLSIQPDMILLIQQALFTFCNILTHYLLLITHYSLLITHYSLPESIGIFSKTYVFPV